MRHVVCLIVVTLLVSTGIALAVPSGKVIEFDKSSEGLVKFDGKVHAEAGSKCKDCHNSEVFPKMKQGTVTITMEEIYAGKFCGFCHDGQRAFDAKANCERCHIKQ